MKFVMCPPVRNDGFFNYILFSCAKDVCGILLFVKRLLKGSRLLLR